MNVGALIEMVRQLPQVQRAVDVMAQQFAQSPMMAEDIDAMLRMLEAVIQDPRRYPEVREAAIRDGVLSAQDVPEQFDPAFLLSVYVALSEYRKKLPEAREFSRGGLNQIAAQGRGGDTMLAHINPREAEMLRRAGGSGGVNPNTGLREYKGGGGVLGAIIPLALNFIAPTLGSAIGAAMGASGTAASMLGSAVIGGLSSGISGGDPLRGAVMGGLGSGLGDVVGGKANELMGLNLGQTGQSVLGGALTGGATAALGGGNFGQGVLSGALGSAAGTLGQQGAPGAVGAGLKSFGNALTAGFSPQQSVAAGALSGLANSMLAKPQGATPLETKPSDAVVKTLAAPQAPGGFNLQQLAPLALLGTLGSPPEVAQAVSSMSPEQQAYFNRPSVKWDWNKMQSDAAARGMSLQEYMSSAWPQITSGAYNSPPVANMAAGGPLGVVARLARGSGSGRQDTIDAKLSDGEYVMDAETVAMLGDGSTDEGARRLDTMREQLRKHKGKTLARGKFSPDAKSPLAYLKGAA